MPSDNARTVLDSDHAVNLHKEVLENMYDGVYYVDQSKKIILWNRGAEEMTGYTRDEVKGSCCADNILRHINDKGDELCSKGCPLGRTLDDGKIRNASVYLHHKEGYRVPVSIRISPVFNDHKEIIGAVEIFTDNSKDIDLIKELEVLRNENYTDILTQVGNRKFADFDLNKRFDDLEEFGIDFGVLFFDIDNFKEINDTYGHDVGDETLKLAAKTTYNIIRSLDTVCRWGGDEFIVILPNVDNKALAIIAEKIRRYIEKTWLQADGTIIRATVSIGGTMATSGDTVDTLVKRADSLMYDSKSKGRNCFSLG